jgi:transcription termination factor NusB
LRTRPAARPQPKVVAVSPAEEFAEAPSARLATMAESTAALQRASHLHDGVTRHLEQIDAQTERHLVKAPASRRRSVSPEVAQAVSLTRSPRSARQAVVAALILGPPKALER